MNKAIAALSLMGLATAHSASAAAQSVSFPERVASPVDESERLAGSGIFAVLLAVAAGVGIILLVEEEEDDLPESP